MERFQRFQNTLQHHPSTVSSVYSNDDEKPSTCSTSAYYAESGTSTSSRTASSIPSYMNAVSARKPIKPRPLSTANDLSVERPVSGGAYAQPTPTMPNSAPIAKGMLFVAMADEPHEKTVFYIEMMLKRAEYSSVVLLGPQWREAELKQLKMNVYAVLGRLGREAGVRLELQQDWHEAGISDAVARLKGSDGVHGVLCGPMLGKATSEADMGWEGLSPLEMDESECEQQWKYTVAFLRNVAKATMLTPRSSTERPAPPGFFLVTEPGRSNPTNGIYKAACDHLISQIARGVCGTTVAYADTVLIPEPELESKNGRLELDSHEFHNEASDDFRAGESPTKLWNIWALQDEMNVVY